MFVYRHRQAGRAASGKWSIIANARLITEIVGSDGRRGTRRTAEARECRTPRTAAAQDHLATAGSILVERRTTRIHDSLHDSGVKHDHWNTASLSSSPLSLKLKKEITLISLYRRVRIQSSRADLFLFFGYEWVFVDVDCKQKSILNFVSW